MAIGALAYGVGVADCDGQVPVPPALQAGDQYHLVFVSSTTRDGLSGDVADYDAHVQAAADSAGIGSDLGISWSALVSVGDATSPFLNARDRVVVGPSTPVFNVGLAIVAMGFADLWDGSLTSELGLDELGRPVFGDAWTGSTEDGVADSLEYLGSSAPTAWCGRSFTTDETWLHYFNPSKTSRLHVFAISEELEVESESGSESAFLRGDCNDDGAVDISDGVCILIWLFAGRETPVCLAATNTNGDDATNIADATYLLNYLFVGGPPPVAPFQSCGPGTVPADAELGCADPPVCRE